jgi:hypothetical protein
MRDARKTAQLLRRLLQGECEFAWVIDPGSVSYSKLEENGH